MNWREPIVIDLAIHRGETCIMGTRMPVSVIIGSVADGDIREWLERRRPAKWPAEVINFRGISGIARFEQDRKKLKPSRSPFDAVYA